MVIDIITTLLYGGLFLSAAALVVFPKRFRPQTVVHCGETSIGIVLGQKEGWVEVMQLRLTDGQVEYRTETFVPEKLKALPPKRPTEKILHQLAPLLLQRNQLQQQLLDLRNQLHQLQPLLQAPSSHGDLVQRTQQHILGLEQQNVSLLETLDDYVKVALLSAQVQQTALALEQLPDPITLYLQQQQLEKGLQSLQSELKIIDQLKAELS